MLLTNKNCGYKNNERIGVELPSQGVIPTFKINYTENYELEIQLSFEIGTPNCINSSILNKIIKKYTIHGNVMYLYLRDGILSLFYSDDANIYIIIPSVDIDWDEYTLNNAVKR